MAGKDNAAAPVASGRQEVLVQRAHARWVLGCTTPSAIPAAPSFPPPPGFARRTCYLRLVLAVLWRFAPTSSTQQPLNALTRHLAASREHLREMMFVASQEIDVRGGRVSLTAAGTGGGVDIAPRAISAGWGKWGWGVGANVPQPVTVPSPCAQTGFPGGCGKALEL